MSGDEASALNVEGWYSARCLFRHERAGRRSDKPCYEERVTLWRADSFAHAMRLAESEGREYAEDVGALWCDLVQVYVLSDDPGGQGAEVFSLMRESDAAPGEYVHQFFDTGQERQGITRP